MAKPARNSAPHSAELKDSTFFVSTQTSLRKYILQSERMATLLMGVLRGYALLNKFKLHDFVVMPDHLHLLLTVGNGMSIEKAVQLIKGNFSYRAKKELGFSRDIWQRGFSEVRILDRGSFLAHRYYIGDNPLKCGLAKTPEEYPYSSFYFRKLKKAAGAKAQ